MSLHLGSLLVVTLALGQGSQDAGVEPDAGLPLKVTPIIAPAYTPELGFIGSVGAALTWDGSPGSAQTPRSSLTAVASYTTLGAFLSQVRLNTFWLDDRVRFSMLVDVRDQPDQYFGVGLLKALRTVPSAEGTSYRKLAWQADPRTLVKLVSKLYAGVVFDLRGTRSRDVSAGVAADPNYQAAGGASTMSSGVGATLVWDSRDVPINAYRGWYLAFDWVVDVPTPIGNSRWMSAGFDYRHAITLGRDGSTLTWQLRYRTAWGGVPWSDLPSVGTPFDLRAYRLGRFRDVTAAVALVEYRWMMPFEPTPWWKLWTRLGFAVWAGVGALGSTPLPDFSAVLPAAGVGLRILIQDRVTLRLDFGVGRGSTAFYFQFLEAF